MRKIIITGANGFLGKYFCQWFLNQGWEVIGLTRHGGVIEGAKAVLWDGRSKGAWAAELDGAEVVLNLAGKSVNCRYGKKNQDLIFQTRLESTKTIGEAINDCRTPPRLWLNSSTATIYRHAEDRPQDEETGEIGEGFSVEVAKAWEKELRESDVPGSVKKVALRTAIVIANEAGTVFDYLKKIAALGLGGKMGSGRQRMSWIHVKDLCRAVDWIIHRECPQSFYNVVAPQATDNHGCMASFRRIAGRRFGLPASRWMLEVGTFLMRSETELVLKSRWVIPGRLEGEGFQFHWDDFDEALDDLAHRPGISCLK